MTPAAAVLSELNASRQRTEIARRGGFPPPALRGNTTPALATIVETPRRASAEAPETWADTLIHLYSFSKAYRLTGHRVGAVVTSEARLAEVEKFLDTVALRSIRVVWAPPAPTLARLEYLSASSLGSCRKE